MITHDDYKRIMADLSVHTGESEELVCPVPTLEDGESMVDLLDAMGIS